MYVCRTGEKEHARFAVTVHEQLHRTKQIRRLLDFVSNRGMLDFTEKSIRVYKGGIKDRPVIEREITGLTFRIRYGLDEGRFADLPCAHNQDDRKILKRFDNRLVQISSYRG
jgi:hypothetical protein